MRPCSLLALLCLVGSSFAQTPPVPIPPETPKDVEKNKEPEKPKWNVSLPPGEMTEVPIETDEGTWMNLDVSRDGTTIVFDLLGDLYTMPIAGGEATAITSGIEWDMQPRFSPDGTSIAFTSDRTGENGKGGDNIWVMTKDTAGAWGPPRQVTKETYRLLTQPIWTPDGQYIIARKHFTSRRSLGAGEMWMYHATGKTDGLQLTTKQTEQKDTGEPALSPDGRYLYYSLDASPGQNFEYDKDSNTGIYAIDRLDLVKGETERLIAGPGGACRPTPSPDGKSIAFVRRVRYTTTLCIQDLASSKATPIYSELERDNQETWAVHGVYPQIAWTPDGTSIVFWAKGRIRRLDVASGKAEVVPFRVKTSRKVAKAVRFMQEVAPAEFDVKMLRDVAVSPKGDVVAFQALGHIYLRDLPNGTPRRLTKDEENFEFFPAWSRDGKFIAYCSWSDDTLGTVKVTDLSMGRSTVISTEPGHYVDPCFSPDGRYVVYGKVSGGYLTSPLWSAEPGVYIVRNRFHEDFVQKSFALPEWRLSKRGTNPQFGAENDRVYLSERSYDKESDKVNLFSLNLNGTEERTHAKSDWATEFRVSPDGKWLAFVERFSVCITPLVATGRAVDLGPKATNAPVVKVSSDAGWNIHWSGDSSTLYWSQGPELYSQSVSAAFASFTSLEKDAPKLPEAKAVNIGFKAKQDVPTKPDGSASVIAFENAKILTMEDTPGESQPDGKPVRAGKIIDRGTVLVEGNRIKAVGRTGEVAVPTGADRRDCNGSVIMPGLIDVHAHGGQGSNGMTPQKNWIHYANLAFGVTTIHDPSNDTQAIFAASELARTGAVLSPRTFSTGTILYGATGAYRAEVDSLDDAIFHLKRMKEVGAFSVKSYNQPRRDQRQQVLEAARQLGMMVVPEGGALFQHNMTMVIDGHTSVEHTLPIEMVYRDVTQLWGATQTGYTPTLGVAYGGMGGENYWYAKTNVWDNARLMNFVPRYIVDPRSRRRTDAPDEEWNHVRAAAMAKKLLDAGVRPTIGAHGQLAGLAAHWEMWMFVQGGFTPFEALRAATIDGAWYIGLDKDLGSITPGKLADLIVLSKDPTVNIRDTESITHVMLNGRLYDAMEMREIAPRAGSKPTLFFEDLQKGGWGGTALLNLGRFGGGCAGCGRPGAGCFGAEEPHAGPSGYR